MKYSGLVMIFVLALASLVAAQSKSIPPSDITSEHVGKDVSVEGRVYTVNKSNAGMHLYFGADTSSAFQVLIPASVVYKFQVDIEKKFSSRDVRATGKVEEEGGKLFIRVEETNQLRVVQRRRRTS